MLRLIAIFLLNSAVALPASAPREPELELDTRELPTVEDSLRSAATTVSTYQYDDNAFERSTLVTRGGVPTPENEMAQRFTLSSSGTLTWAEVCLGNRGRSPKSVDFSVYVRRDSGGLPGTIVDRSRSNVRGPLDPQTYGCFRVTDLDAGVGTGAIWVSVEWTPGTTAESAVALMLDDSNSRGRRAFRARNSAGGSYADWQSAPTDYVFGIRLGVAHSTSTPPPPDPPTDPPPRDGTLHDGQFVLDFGAVANGIDYGGQIATWSSRKGILFWLFDDQNPEGLVKVLDGRSHNGHWWFDVAVASDLVTTTGARHLSTGAAWSVSTGRAREFGVTDPDIAGELIHCAAPLDRADRQCAIVGLGTTVSLRDAWTAQGWIPSKYYSGTSQATSAAMFALFRAQRPSGPEDQ